jgi:hypothetical protein
VDIGSLWLSVTEGAVMGCDSWLLFTEGGFAMVICDYWPRMMVMCRKVVIVLVFCGYQSRRVVMCWDGG